MHHPTVNTASSDQWSYYVVDHLPTMANIYRFQTVNEAIDCYRSIDPTLRSAIGSCFGGVHEMDHIQRMSNGLPVLITSADKLDSSLWRDSPEVQRAIDFMISQLNVQHEYNHTIFGPQAPSVVVELERHTTRPLDSYFCHSILYPNVPGQYHSAIDEVFVMGHGWLKPKAFYKLLQDSRPGRNGEGRKDLFVERLCVRYLDTQTGYSGCADISPQQYGLLHARTQQLLSKEMLTADLKLLLGALDAVASNEQQPSLAEDPKKMHQDLAAGRFHGLRNSLGAISQDTHVPFHIRQNAAELQNRLTALIPPELRRLTLSTAIQSARQDTQTSDRQSVASAKRQEVAR